MCREIRGRFAMQARALIGCQLGAKGTGDLEGNVRLDREGVGQSAIICFAPPGALVERSSSCEVQASPRQQH